MHQIFQHTGLTPDEFYMKPKWAQVFMLESMKLALESTEKGEDGNV